MKLGHLLLCLPSLLVVAACDVTIDASPGDASIALTDDASPAADDASRDAADGGPSSDSGDADADAGSDAADAGACSLNDAWVATPQGTMLSTSHAVTSGACTYRFTTWSKPSGGPTPPLQKMFLEKLDAAGMSCAAPEGSIEVGSCMDFPAPHCTWNEPHALLTTDEGGGLRIATLTQLHNARYGYGSFSLAQRDPVSGAPLRSATTPLAPGADATPSIIRASSAVRSGDDIVVTGTSNKPFAGETGAGDYFRMTFTSFLSPTCTAAAVPPSSVARSNVAF